MENNKPTTLSSESQTDLKTESQIESQTESTKPPEASRQGIDKLMIILLIVGAILLPIVFFCDLNTLQRCIANSLYLIDPRYWPIWLVPIIWGLIFWLLINWACYFDIVRKCKCYLRLLIISGTIIATSLVLMRLHNVSSKEILIWIYNNIYLTFVIMPTANFMTSGKPSWQFLILPITALTVIVVLLFIAKKTRRKKL
jgi:hypothetical protein